MINAPLVSVIIPAYNSANTLANALESVSKQSYSNIECIVIDDGSTDKTSDFIKNRPEIQYFFQENSGAAAARNNGIRHAKGKYIAFLDADDFWHKDKILIQTQVMESVSEDYVLIYCLRRFSKAAEKFSHLKHELIYDEKKVQLLNFGDLISSPYLGTPSVMVRAHSIRAINGYDTSLVTAEDIDMYLRLCNDALLVRYEEEMAYITRVENSLGSQLRSYQDNIDVFTKFERENTQLSENFNQQFNVLYEYVYNNWLTDLMYLGKGREARKVLRKMKSEGVRVKAKYVKLKSYLAWFKKILR